MSERSLDELRADVEEAREELVDTTQLLAARLDVKSRAQQTVDELRAYVVTHRQQVGGGVVAFLVLVVVRKRRRARKTERAVA